MTSSRREADILRAVLEYLKLAGIFCWRQNTGAVTEGRRFIRFGPKGGSDILGVLPGGRILALEVKRSWTVKVSEAQLAFLEAIRNAGGVAAIVTSVDEARAAVETVI